MQHDKLHYGGGKDKGYCTESISKLTAHDEHNVLGNIIDRTR